MKRQRQALSRHLLPLTACLAMSLPAAQAEDGEKNSYIGLAATQLPISDLPNTNGKTRVTAATVTLGTYIEEIFRTEIRAGMGLDNTEAAEGLTVGTDYFLSWYFGAEYKVNPYFGLYGLAGFTHYVGDVERAILGSYPTLTDEMVDSSFGVSYTVGANFRIIEDVRGFLDYGRLHSDTISGTSTKQWNLGVTYAF